MEFVTIRQRKLHQVIPVNAHWAMKATIARVLTRTVAFTDAVAMAFVKLVCNHLLQLIFMA